MYVVKQQSFSFSFNFQTRCPVFRFVEVFVVVRRRRRPAAFRFRGRVSCKRVSSSSHPGLFLVKRKCQVLRKNTGVKNIP